MEVHRELRHGLLEPPYQDALEIELTLRGIPFVREELITIFYKGRALRSTYRPDFLCFGNIVVELKSLREIGAVEEAQLLNYLRITKHRRGVLINFGAKSLGYRRYVLDTQRVHVPAPVEPPLL